MIAKLLVVAACVIASYALPSFIGQPYVLTVLILAMLYAIPAVGLNLMLGGAGLISIGHMAFAGVGGYAAAILMVDHRMSFWTALIVGTLAAAGAGALIGATCLHLRSHFFIIVTLAAGVILTTIFNNWEDVTRGAEGFAGIPRPAPLEIAGLRWDFRRLPDFFRLSLTLLLAVMALQAVIANSGIGRSLRAIRQDEALAAARGLNVFAYKLMIFAVGSGIAGFGGVLRVSFLRVAEPAMFDLQESVNLALITIAGGAGFQAGPILGALLFAGLPEYLRMARDFRFVLFGGLLVVMTIVLPDGLAGLLSRMWRYRRAHATPRAA